MRTMCNEEIRALMRKKRLYNYEVAAQLNVSEFTFCRWLRTELPPEKKQAVLNAIEELTGGVDK